MSDTSISPQMDISQYKQMGSATSRKVLVNPENLSGFTSTSATRDVYFAIPASAQTMINSQNSYLTCDLETSTDESSLCNGSGSSLIKTLELVIGNTSVELLDSYATFASIAEDFQSKGRSLTVQSILGAHSESAVKTGKPITSKVRISIPLFSSVLGTLAQNHIPAVDGMRLRLSFASSHEALIDPTTSADPTYSLSNIALNLDYLDIVPSVWGELMAESGGVFKAHASGVSVFEQNIDTISANHNLLIPARLSAIKNYFTVFRKSSNNGLITANSCGDRMNIKIKNYAYLLGGKSYPSIPVTAHDGTVNLSSDVFTEVLKCFHAQHSPQFDCVFNLTQYQEETGTSGTGSFLIGYDWEESGVSSALVSGIDGIGANTFLQMNIVPSGGSVPVTCSTFCVHELITEFNMMDGTVNVTR